MFDWNEEEVSDDEDMTQVKVLMALADDELSVRKNHAGNGEWIDIIMKKVNILLSMDEDSDWQTYLKYINIDLKYVEERRLNLLSKYNKIIFELNKCRDDLLALKQVKLEAVTFQIQNTELTKLNHALYDQLKEERKITESSSKNDVKENPFIPASVDYDDEMVSKSKYWAPTDPDSSKELGSEPQTPLPPLKNLQGASPSSESVSRTVTIYDTKLVTSSFPTEVKINDRESKIDELTKLVSMLMDEKISSTQMIQESKYVNQQPESPKSDNSSKLSQDSKPNGKNTDSSKLVRPKPL
ncbi:hypothetical protein Tco_1474738 [Tanacetum coccineum]